MRPAYFSFCLIGAMVLVGGGCTQSETSKTTDASNATDQSKNKDQTQPNADNQPTDEKRAAAEPDKGQQQAADTGDEQTAPGQQLAASGNGSDAAKKEPKAKSVEVAANTVPANPDADPEAAPSEEDSNMLGIGSAAPPIAIASWFKGEEIEEFEPGKVYVVEFWATWCPPCRDSMPHLSELQKEYKDKVSFIGVTREGNDVVQEFMERDHESGKKWFDVVQYRIALDDNDKTSEAYMEAAGQNGIPAAFIVGKDGVVEWIGHPMGMDEPLKKIVDDSWDREEAIAAFKKKQRMQVVMMSLQRAFARGNWDEALGIIDGLIAESPEESQFLLIKMQILQEADRHEEANKLLAKVIDHEWENARLLNMVAWRMAEDEEAKHDLKLLLKAAKRASELTKDKDASVLDTVARVYFKMGNLDEAIKWQKQAVDAGDDDPRLAETLKEYRQRKDSEKSEAEEKKSESQDEAASE